MGNATFSLPVLAIVLPAAGAIIAMSMTTRRSAGLTSLATWLVQLALLLVGVAAISGDGVQHFIADPAPVEWFSEWGISFNVRLDASALGMVGLTTIVTGCAAMFAWWADRDRPGAFHGLLWLTCAAVNGLWVSRDLVLFYVFFEAMLIPLLILVGRWGGEARLRASLTMFIYTLAGSLPMLVGIIALGISAGTFNLDDMAQQAIVGSLEAPDWALACFLLALAIKAPILPLHGWMPLAYREAPAEVTAVLSGVVSKAAAFGMLLVVLPLFPDQLAGRWGDAITWVALASLLYGSIAAFRQPDARGVVAYSSMAQMALITIGLSSFLGAGGEQGVAGAYMQMVNHGLISAALFLACGIVERRAGTGELTRLGGLAGGRPVFATVMLIVTMCALAVPGSNAFAGELLILTGIFQGAWSYAWLWALVGSTAIVLAALYALRLLSAVMHSPQDDSDERSAPARERFGGDLRPAELGVLLPLVACMLALSVWPDALGRSMNERPVALDTPVEAPAR